MPETELATSPLRPSYLVQRLEAPRPAPPGAVKPHHVFGGAAVGLSQEGWDAIDPIFTLSYMGAAEYEFGVIPRVLQAVGKAQEKYVGFEMQLSKKDIGNHWKRGSRRRPGEDPLPDKQAKTVYVLCRSDLVEPIKVRIKEMAKDKVRMKERACFVEALDPLPGEKLHYLGWLDLENEFFFFVDKTMFEGTANLFQIRCETPKKSKKERSA